MLASLRGRPGARPPGGTLRLVSARVGRRRRDQALPLVRGQRLVFSPLLAQVLLVLLARHLRQPLVVLARLAALLRRELGPCLHAPRDAFLFLGFHARIALRDGDPLHATLRLERIPVGLERRQYLLLLGGELGPGGACPRLRLHGLRGWLGSSLLGVRRRLRRRLRRRPGGDYEGQDCCESAQHHSSAARFFSQFWNPRSR